MTMNRTLRRCAALLGLCALLFADLSVAAYACPMDGAPSVSASAGMPEGCAAVQPNLCKAHCYSGQDLPGQAATDVPAVSLVHGLVASLYLPALRAIVPGFQSGQYTPSPANDPPATIRNCCFRL